MPIALWLIWPAILPKVSERADARRITRAQENDINQ